MTRDSDTITPPLGLQQKEVPPAPELEGTAAQAQAARVDHGWSRICGIEDIPRLGARVVHQPVPPNVAIFRTADDRFFALADRCPHRGGPLSQGIVFGQRVACPLHNTCIELDSGCAVAPDKGVVRSYAVKVEAGDIYIELG